MLSCDKFRSSGNSDVCVYTRLLYERKNVTHETYSLSGNLRIVNLVRCNDCAMIITTTERHHIGEMFDFSKYIMRI